jgi:hypothetical protein
LELRMCDSVGRATTTATIVATLCMWCLVTTLCAKSEALDEHLVTDGREGFTVYEVLGFLNEYYGRVTMDKDDVVERFFPNERSIAEKFGMLLERLRNEQGIADTIVKDVDRESFVTFRSRGVARKLNQLYSDRRPEGFFDGPDGRVPLTRLFVSPSMFNGVDRSNKVAYIAGAYCRHGRANAIGFANASHKVSVLAELLRDVGCQDVRVASITDRAPNTNVVRFSFSGCDQLANTVKALQP